MKIELDENATIAISVVAMFTFLGVMVVAMAGMK
jgi:hypothetical protein